MLMNHIVRMAVYSTLFFISITPLYAENWPAWRGPRGDGTSAEKQIPFQWSETQNILWKTSLPGPAASTPVVWQDRIFVSSTEKDNLVLLCMNTDGTVLWKKLVGTGNSNARGDEG